MQTPSASEQTFTETLVAKDGTRFELKLNKFEPTYAYALIFKIGPAIVPAILAAQTVTSKSNALDMMPALTAMFEQLTPERAASVRDDLLRATTVVRDDDKGTPENIDLTSPKQINKAFRGGYLKEMLLAMKFAAGVNFANFFDASDLPAVVETPTPSP